MHVVMVCAGSRGDVQPMIALAHGATQAGHEVTIVAARDFGPLVTAHGLRFIPFSYTIADEVESDLGRGWLGDSSGHPIRELRSLRQLTRQWAPMLADDLRGLAGSADVYVSGILTLDAAVSLAEVDGARAIGAVLSPLLPTADGRAGLAAVRPRATSRLNRGVGDVLAWQMGGVFGAVGDELRRRLGAMARGRRDYVDRLRTTATAVGVSPLLVPQPQDWPISCRVTGDWPLRADQSWQPPAGLREFLAAGPPPIYVSFGSMVTSDPTRTAHMVLNAARLAGVRTVVRAGPGMTEEILTAGPKQVFLVSDVPHDWLFPQVQVVVHHGGAGTTHAALRAGVPSVVVPHMGDQPYWGRRLAELGVATSPLPLHRLTAPRLAARIEAAGACREQAASMGASMAAEQGVAAAVHVLGLER